MADPREHYCACGRWGSFGTRAARGAMVWRCSWRDGAAFCPDARQVPAQSVADIAARPPEEPDLFGQPG